MYVNKENNKEIDNWTYQQLSVDRRALYEYIQGSDLVEETDEDDYYEDEDE